MREKYENGVKLLYEYLIPYNETEETLLGFTSIFEGLERHAKLQIEILNRCDDKLDVELPNEPSVLKNNLKVDYEFRRNVSTQP